MHRRRFLEAGVALASVGAAGCLGFETQSAWRNTPIVENRPEAAYIPASIEDMGTYGMVEAGPYTVSLMYSYPHRFWTITGQRTHKAGIGDDDSVHLMASVWDTKTGTILPVGIGLTVEGSNGTAYAGQLWPMLSQRMGFHHGDNLALDSGNYTAKLQVIPMTSRLTGALNGRFGKPRTAEIEFEFDSDDIYNLEFTTVEQKRRGNRGAIPLMSHDGRMPSATLPPPEELPGTHLGTGRTGDAKIAVTVLDDARFGDGPYLAVSPRTPHHRVMLPRMALSATITRGGETVYSGPLENTLDPDIGIHYGTTVGSIRPGDTVTVGTDSVPQLSRHDGYETAFMEMPPVEVTAK